MTVEKYVQKLGGVITNNTLDMLNRTVYVHSYRRNSNYESGSDEDTDDESSTEDSEEEEETAGRLTRGTKRALLRKRATTKSKAPKAKKPKRTIRPKTIKEAEEMVEEINADDEELVGYLESWKNEKARLKSVSLEDSLNDAEKFTIMLMDLQKTDMLLDMSKATSDLREGVVMVPTSSLKSKVYWVPNKRCKLFAGLL